MDNEPEPATPDMPDRRGESGGVVLMLDLKAWRLPYSARPRRMARGDCPNCAGSGVVVLVDEDGKPYKSDCPTCGGSGEIDWD